ncbi:MAG: hypothetical protein HOK97_21000 [Deltaproteobacteria bacterium]|nr:hypothetical protein [Deltaproteobacteria bacterium]
MMNLIKTAAGLCLLLTVQACSTGVGDIDRSQPGKLKKQALQGEWYYRQTVVDVPFTGGMTFVGEQSITERIHFEISENLLTAYRSYEKVEGSEIPSQPGDSEYQGAPIAAFRISSHFDVIRNYNDATGEQSNVISENTSDRPWYEREYIRVDWSHNLLANFDFIAAGESGTGISSQSASYAVTDPMDADAPVFSVQSNGQWNDYKNPMTWGQLPNVDYFDITQKLQIFPDVFEMAYDDGTTEQWPACWFYEWGPWDCASQTIKVRASFLKVQPSSYEPLPYPDNYIARDDNGDAIRTMWDEEVGYRRCTAEEDQFCNPVRIPMFDWFGFFRRERESYDRGYGITEQGRIYLADRFNIWEQSVDANGENIAYEKRTVKPIVYHLSANFPEDLKPAAQEVAAWWNRAFQDTVRSLQSKNDVGDVFVLADETYAYTNGDIFNENPRNGDLRFNHIYWVDQPQFDSFLGYGPSAVDPLTGEIIAADAYIYGGSIDTYATYGADLVELTRGDIGTREFIEGENVGSALAALHNQNPANRDQVVAQLNEVMAAGTQERMATVRSQGPDAVKRDHNFKQSRLAMLDDSPLADRLWNNEMRATLEKRFGRPLKPSEFTGGRLARAMKRHRVHLATHRVDMQGFEDTGILGLLGEFDGKTRSEIIASLRSYLFKAVAAHEVGHTLGLRHNFAGSADAINYHDHYWEIRNPEAQALDLPTREEMQAGIREYAYSSIMDYGARFNSDIRGIGKYDVAAIKFGYGQLVETFTNPPDWNEHDVLGFYNLDDAVQKWTHYTDLPALFETSAGTKDGLANISDRRDVRMEEIIKWMTLDTQANDFTDTLVPYRFCSDEYVSARWDCELWDEGADPYEMVSYAIQSWREQYIFQSFKRQKRYLDPFDVYYDVYSRIMAPMASQYHLWVYDQWEKPYEWTWLDGQGTSATDNSNWNLDPHGGLAATAAAMASVNFLTEVIATPEPGSYYVDPNTQNLTWWANYEEPLCDDTQDSSVDACSDAFIPVGQGRYAYSEFDEESGYYWFERVRVAGSFWDKLAAIETLSDPSTYFLGVDDVADATAYNMGFNLMFPHAVNGLFGSVINDNYQRFAPRLDAGGVLEYPKPFLTPEVAVGDNPSQTGINGTIVDPATNFTVALYTMYYGMALLNANFDQTFNNNARIWLDGHGESVTPSAATQTVSFVNPFNQLTYQAAKSPDANAYSLGYEMLGRANTMRSTIAGAGSECFYSDTGACSDVITTRWELDNIIENIEVLRGYYDVFGYAWF